MNKKMDELIRKADAALRDTKRVKILDTTFSYPKAFKGYISAFGAAVVMSGIRPAMAFYINKDSGSEEKRDQLLNAIALMLDKERYGRDFDNGEALFRYSLNNETDLKRLTEDISNCAIALKLALRTYPQTEKEGSNGN